MFGIVRPCRHVMCAGLYADWMGHLCGLCLALRDEHGHLSRVVTSYDGLLVSVLTEAQSAAPVPRRRAGACALRGFKGADVVQAEGVRLAASVSLLLAAGKTRDHVADRDGAYARRPVAAGAARLASRWSSRGAATAGALGFDPAPLTAAAGRQAVLEREPARPLRELTAPAEDAVAAAFAHTAVLTGRPHNREALEAAGRGFGRLAHLIDAVEDLDDDRASGSYNPLAATGTGLDEARRHCDAAQAEVSAAVDALDLARPALTRALLVRETSRAVTRAFAAAEKPDTDKPGTKRDPGGLLSLACMSLSCCTCGLYRAPWDDERENSFCQRFDCSGCGECGNCCDCCSCCGEDGCCSCDC